MDWSGALFGDEPDEPIVASKTPTPVPTKVDATPELVAMEAASEPEEIYAPIVEMARSLVETFTADVAPVIEIEEDIDIEALDEIEDATDAAIEVADSFDVDTEEATLVAPNTPTNEALGDISADLIDPPSAESATEPEEAIEAAVIPAFAAPEGDSPIESIEVAPMATAEHKSRALASIDLVPAESAVPEFVSWADDSEPEVTMNDSLPAESMDPIAAFDATFSDEAIAVPPPLPHLRDTNVPNIEDLELPPPLPPYERTAPLEDSGLRYRERVAPERGPRSKGIIGIDLGTTYSCAAIVEDGRARMLGSRQGGPTIASVVRYAEDGRTVVGTTAARSASRHPERTILGSKRLMGRAFTSPVVQDVQHHFAYDVVPGREGEAAIRIDDEIISLEDVAASILEEIREACALQLEESINRAVITCPAHFTEPQREAVRRAGELAGFYVERVLNEPTAAALNYAADHHLERRRIVVYDLGGGTFDVSVLEVDGDVFEVLATGGDSFLGGLDFDACIVEMLSEALLEQEHLDAREDPAAIAKLFEFAERAKRDLSERTSTIVQIDHLVVQPYAARSLSVGLRRTTVERAFEPLVAQTLHIVTETIERAGLAMKDIDDVVLVGGQSRAPIVRAHVEALLGRPALASVDPEEAVALGAARFAASLDTIDDIILIDALPLSIGVGLPGGRFKPLLTRDQRLPASRTYHVRTTRDDQTDYEIALFQGESDRVEDNEPLGILTLEDLPKGPRGTVKIEVTLAVDAESVLEVHACEPSTGQKVGARMVTRGTAEELRVRLGLPAQPTHEELERRRAKKLNRPKKVWRWITGLFRRER